MRAQLLMALALSGSLPAQDLVFATREHGFRIERPSKAWTLQQRHDASKATFYLTLTAPKAATVRVQLTVTPTTATEPKIAVDKALQFMKGKPGYTDIDVSETGLDGKKAPGVSVLYKGYRLQQFYAIENGMLYTLLRQVPNNRQARYAKDFDKIFASFRTQKPGKKAVAQRRMRVLAARCGSQIRWAKSWAKAEARAKKEDRLVLVVVSEYSAFNMSDTFNVSAFMNEDVLGMIGSRYVALRWRKGMPAPFVSQDDYGLSGSTFGIGMLITSPEGKVLHQSNAYEPYSVFAFLMEGVRQFPELPTVIQAKLPGIHSLRQLARWPEAN